MVRVVCAEDMELMSDVYCSECWAFLDYGYIAWMDMDSGTMYCPDCHPAQTREYVVIEWPHERGTSVLHGAKQMELDMWR